MSWWPLNCFVEQPPKFNCEQIKTDLDISAKLQQLNIKMEKMKVQQQLMKFNVDPKYNFIVKSVDNNGYFADKYSGIYDDIQVLVDDFPNEVFFRLIPFDKLNADNVSKDCWMLLDDFDSDFVARAPKNYFVPYEVKSEDNWCHKFPEGHIVTLSDAGYKAYEAWKLLRKESMLFPQAGKATRFPFCAFDTSDIKTIPHYGPDCDLFI